MFQGSVEENVLGITWNNQSDTLSFKVNFELINQIIEAEQRKRPALQIGIPQDTDNGCDVIVVLLIRLPPNLDSGLTS